MNIDRPKLAIGTFAATLIIAFMGMGFLPSTRVDYTYKVASLGRGYLSISVWDLNKHRHVDVKLIEVKDTGGKDIAFTNPGHEIWRLNTGKHKKFSLITLAYGHKRILKVTIATATSPVVETGGPIAFRCKDMGFMAVPLEGMAVFGLPNPFMLIPRQGSGSLSPVLPVQLRLEFRSSGKSNTINFKNDSTPVVSMPVQPARPLIFKVMMGGQQLCTYSYYSVGRAKGMVMDKATILQDTHNPVFNARLRILNPPMNIHCLMYQRENVSLKGPLGYKFLNATSHETMISMPMPARPGLYYVVCTPDPVTPLYYYVRRNVLIAGSDPKQQVMEIMDSFDMPEKNRRTILSLEKTGRLKPAIQTMAANMPDLLPPAMVTDTLKNDRKVHNKKHEQAAEVLMVLIGMAFAGITLWLILVTAGGHRGLQQAMAEEGVTTHVPWSEMALFVLVNLVNLAMLLYTLYLVFF